MAAERWEPHPYRASFVSIMRPKGLSGRAFRERMNETMKKSVLMLAIVGFGLNLAIPAFAMAPKGGDLTVYQEDQCEEGQVWDDEQQKCVPAE